MISLARFESLATVTLALCSLSTPPLSHYQRLACGLGVILVTGTWICGVLDDSVHMPPFSGLQDRTGPLSLYRECSLSRSTLGFFGPAIGTVHGCMVHTWFWQSTTTITHRQRILLQAAWRLLRPGLASSCFLSKESKRHNHAYGVWPR